MGLFPAENNFNKEFLASAIAVKIPVSSLKGLVALESAFNPAAYREEAAIKDASYGLMQILNRTAQSVGFTGQPAELLDPATNLAWGSKFFAGLVKRYPSYLDAVAAYNMGSPRKAKDLVPGTTTYDTIVRIYGQPGPDWVYQNQPYVDRVAAYTAYYQAVEDGRMADAEAIEIAIKKKDMQTPRNFFDRLLSDSFLDKRAPSPPHLDTALS